MFNNNLFVACFSNTDCSIKGHIVATTPQHSLSHVYLFESYLDSNIAVDHSRPAAELLTN